MNQITEELNIFAVTNSKYDLLVSNLQYHINYIEKVNNSIDILPKYLNILSIKDINTIYIPIFIGIDLYGFLSFLIPMNIETTNFILENSK